MSSSPRRSSRATNTVLIVFLVFWTIGTLAGNLLVTFGMLRQADAGFRFRTTTGTVVSTSLRESSGDTGPTYEPVLNYSYRVNGTEYTSERVTFGGSWSGSKSQAKKALQAYPLNGSLPVFYDPANPGTSVLRVGVQPEQVMMLLMLTPFSMVMLFMWYAAWKVWAVRNSPGGLGLSTILVSDDGDRVRLGVARHAAALKAGAALAIVSFVVGFIVQYWFAQNLSMAMALGSFAIAYGAATVLFSILRELNASGNYDVIADRSDGSIEIGAGVVRAGAGAYSFEEIGSVSLVSRMTGGDSPTEVFDVVVTLPELVSPNPVPIGRTLSADDAAIFRDWLCSEFGWSSTVV